jgi:hypothetical protein
MKLVLAEIEFEVDAKPVKFSVYHNLPDTFGLSLQDALENWFIRTDKYTAASLCNYIKNKGIEYVCMTETQYKRLNKYENKRNN